MAPIAAIGRFPYYCIGGGDHKNEVIETDESISLLGLESEVQLDVVRAARMRRLASPTSSRGTSPTNEVNSA